MLHGAAALPVAITLIQFAGALVVVWAVGRSFAALLGRDTIEGARLILLDGALSALGFTLAASLLKLLAVASWDEIGAFAAIFALRTFVKTALKRERAWLVAHN